MSYIAKSNIIHNGVSYARGQEVKELSASEARRLVLDGVLADTENGEEVIVEEPKVEVKPEEKTEEKKEDDDLDSSDTDDFIPEGFENHVVTEQDLLDNPDLVAGGTKVGDTIQRAKVEPTGADLSAGL